MSDLSSTPGALGEDEMIAVVVAIEMLRASRGPGEELDATPVWRFSGRWFVEDRGFA